MSENAIPNPLGNAMGTNRKQFEMFFERMIDGFAYHKIVLDRAGKPVDYIFLEVNTAFEKMTGLKREKILGKRVTEVLKGIENDPSDWIGVYGKVAITCKPVEFENFAKPLDKWFRVSAYCPEKGFFVALFEDITKSRKAEQALEEREKRFHSAMDNMLEGCQIISRDWRYTYINDAAEQHNRRPREELLGKRYMDMWPEIESTDVFVAIRHCMDKGIHRSMEIEFTFPDGAVGWFDLRIEPIPEGVFILSVDITERKQTERTLQINEQRWQTTLSSIGDAVITTDLAGYVVFLNIVAQKLTGWSLEEAHCRPLKEVFHIVNELTNKEVETPVTRVLKEGTIVGLANHTILIRKDKTRVPIDDSGAPILDEDGKITGVVLVFRDISEKHLARKKLESMAKFPIENSEPVLRIDLCGKLLFANPASFKLLNDESLKVGCLAPEKWRVMVANALASKKELRFEEKHSVMLFEFRIAPLPLEGYANLYAKDITERNKTEEELRRSFDRERFLAELIRNASIAVGVGYSDGSLGMVNAAFQKLTGYSEEELRQVSWSEVLTPPEYIEFEKRKLEELEKTKKPVRYQKEYLRKDGSRVPIELVVHPFLDEKGNVTHYFSFITDITERKKAEDNLKRINANLEDRVAKRTAEVTIERQRLYNVLETLPAYIVLLDKDYHVSFANKVFRDQFGESHGRCCYDFLFRRNSPCDDCETYKVLKSNKPHRWEWTGPNGHDYDIYDFPFVEEDGSTLILEMGVDITERKHAEKKAQEAANKLKDTERLAAIGATAGMVGHDIRNPLQAITSDIYLAKTELASIPVSKEKNNAMESLDEIEKNIDYINKIVQDLQDYARPLNPKIEEVDLNQIIERVITKNGLPNNIEVKVKVSNKARKIYTDSYYLNRILYNLVNNSIQAMPGGGRLAIQARKEGKDIKIAVEDTGVGIPKDIQAKMFTPMFTTKSKGQGFGLPVVKRMIESLGGFVTFESQEGQGTTFIIHFTKK